MAKTKPKTKKTRVENSAINTFINVQIIAVILYIIIFITTSAVGLVADLSNNFDFIFTLISFAFCSFTTGFYAGLKIRQNGIASGIIYALPMNVIVILISLVFADFEVDYILAVTVAILLISSAVGGILAVNKRRRR